MFSQEHDDLARVSGFDRIFEHRQGNGIIVNSVWNRIDVETAGVPDLFRISYIWWTLLLERSVGRSEVEPLRFMDHRLVCINKQIFLFILNFASSFFNHPIDITKLIWASVKYSILMNHVPDHTVDAHLQLIPTLMFCVNFVQVQRRWPGHHLHTSSYSTLINYHASLSMHDHLHTYFSFALIQLAVKLISCSYIFCFLSGSVSGS